MAEGFLDWLVSAGQTIWQVLPLGPTGYGASPYGTLSAFAGNPLLISPEKLVEDGLAPHSGLEGAPDFPADRVDWNRVRSWKERLFRSAWQQASRSTRVREELEVFRSAPEQQSWLADWARFAARHVAGPGASPEVLSAEVEYQEFLQLNFFRQWERLRQEARRRGILLLGDVPIYVSPGSVDIETHPELFALDENGRALDVGGVPPDFFSQTGQLWGYPLYRWDRMAQDGYSWWIERLRAAFRMTDIVRLDHFRAFAAYWAVPAAETTAVNGRGVRGPGKKLFDAVRRALGDVPLVAEDLGTITPDVRRLLARLRLPGMKVLQFAFYEPDSPYLPHRHVPNAVVYTGTHDNDTTRGWWGTLDPDARRRVRDYLGSTGAEIEWDLIRAAYASVADRAIVPLQDVFGLGSEARMNTPAEAEGNWSWRAREVDFMSDRNARLRGLAELAGRREGCAGEVTSRGDVR
jgi:4-alpha-glucanotransferase